MKLKAFIILFFIGFTLFANEIKPIRYSFYGGKYQGTDGSYSLGINDIGVTYLDIEVPQMSKYYRLLNGQIISIQQILHGDDVVSDFGYSTVNGFLNGDVFSSEVVKANGTVRSRDIPVKSVWMPFDVLIYHFQQELLGGTIQNEFEIECFVEKMNAFMKFEATTFYASPIYLDSLYETGELAPSAAWDYLMSLDGSYYVVELSMGGGLNGFYPYKNWFVFDATNNWDTVAFFGGKPGEDMVLVFK